MDSDLRPPIDVSAEALERVRRRVVAAHDELPSASALARWRWGGIAAACAAAAVVAAMLLTSLSSSPDVGAGTAAAALEAAAATAAKQPALPPLAAGRSYHFTLTETGWLLPHTQPQHHAKECTIDCGPPPRTWVVKARVVTQFWVDAAGTGIRLTHIGKPVWRSPQARRGYAAHPFGFGPVSAPLGPSTREAFTHYSYADNLLGYAALQRLPTNPRQLLGWIRRAANSTYHATSRFALFAIVSDTLADAPLRPETRAAFFHALSLIPGIEMVGPVRDPLGRRGVEVAVGWPGRPPRQMLILDPRTGNLLSDGNGGYSGWGIVPTSSVPRPSASSARHIAMRRPTVAVLSDGSSAALVIGSITDRHGNAVGFLPVLITASRGRLSATSAKTGPNGWFHAHLALPAGVSATTVRVRVRGTSLSRSVPLSRAADGVSFTTRPQRWALRPVHTKLSAGRVEVWFSGALEDAHGVPVGGLPILAEFAHRYSRWAAQSGRSQGFTAFVSLPRRVRSYTVVLRAPSVGMRRVVHLTVPRLS